MKGESFWESTQEWKYESTDADLILYLSRDSWLTNTGWLLKITIEASLRFGVFALDYFNFLTWWDTIRDSKLKLEKYCVDQLPSLDFDSHANKVSGECLLCTYMMVGNN